MLDLRPSRWPGMRRGRRAGLGLGDLTEISVPAECCCAYCGVVSQYGCCSPCSLQDAVCPPTLPQFSSQSLACIGDHISDSCLFGPILPSVPVTLPFFFFCHGGGVGWLVEQPHICFRKHMTPWFSASFNKLLLGLVPAGWFVP